MVEAQFVIDAAERGVGIKSALMEHAAVARGLQVMRLNSWAIVISSRRRRTLAFGSMNGPTSSVAGRHLCDDKVEARRLLSTGGLSTAMSAEFDHDDLDAAWSFTRQLGSSVVVKPVSLSRGRGVTTSIVTRDDLAQAMATAAHAYRRRRRSARVLVEQQIDGHDFRFFVVSGKVISVTQRRRARIRGDGERTVRQLIRRKNRRRERNAYLRDYPIPLRLEQLDVLARAGRSLDDVPPRDELVTLRSQSNLSAGGDSIDRTDVAHPGFNQIAVRAVEAIPGIRYAGVDIIARDIRAAPSGDNHVVSEVEFSPAPLSHFPWVGERRDMAGAVLSFYLARRRAWRPR